MSTRSLLLIGLVWAGIGIVSAYTMRRRGHDFFAWLVIGAVLGPLVVPLAVARDRTEHAGITIVEDTRAPLHEGFDVLAGLDGSEPALQALVSAIGLFGHQLSSVTIATVLSYDDERTPSGFENQIQAEKMLEEVAMGLRFQPVTIKLLFGRPEEALADYAFAAGIELIVVGPRGHGPSEALFGSVAGHLIGQSTVPVFVGSAAA